MEDQIKLPDFSEYIADENPYQMNYHYPDMDEEDYPDYDGECSHRYKRELRKMEDEELNRNRREIGPKFPTKVIRVLEKMAFLFDCDLEFDFSDLKSYYGVFYGISPCIRVSHCTSSYANGPSTDYSKEIWEILQAFGFEHKSYGDNGLDSETNWHDTFWYDEFYYPPYTIDF